MKLIKSEEPLIIEAIKNNDGYCPCAIDKNKDTKCMCKAFRDKIIEGYIGECHCGLYRTEPNIIYLCGNTRYTKDFLYWNDFFSGQGYIVLMPENLQDLAVVSNTELASWENVHKQKMTVAEIIFVVDKFGKVADKLANELEKIKRTKKIIYASEFDIAAFLEEKGVK